MPLNSHLRPLIPGATRKKPRSSDRPRVMRPVNISLHLKANKSFVWHIIIQRVDEPIAIRPSIGAKRIFVTPMRFGLAHSIHPMPCPTLPISRTTKESLYHPLERTGGSILKKTVERFRRWGKPGQIEINPPQPNPPLRRR